MIEPTPGPEWRDLQRRVVAILRECGLAAEEAKQVQTVRGCVEIDVYAVDSYATPPSVYFCECKRWSTRVPQGEVQTFRTVVADGGAHVGLVVSSAGFQSGAYDVVDRTNIHLLDWTGFQELFVERWCEEYWIPTLRDSASRLSSYVDPSISDAVIRFERRQRLEAAEAAGMLVSDMWGPPFLPLPGLRRQNGGSLAAAIWRHVDMYRENMPPAVVRATTLRQLLDALLEFCDGWMR